MGTAVLVLAAALSAPQAAVAQAVDCALVQDHQGPDKVLRCGEGLTIHIAPKTRYRLSGGDAKEPGLELESGAVMIEFTPSETRKSFQILTPHAIAAVRGTRWAVESYAERSSTLVVEGAVEVKRRAGGTAVTLREGEGVDVAASGSEPLEVKRWRQKRVRGLLARFGQ